MAHMHPFVPYENFWLLVGHGEKDPDSRPHVIPSGRLVSILFSIPSFLTTSQQERR